MNSTGNLKITLHLVLSLLLASALPAAGTVDDPPETVTLDRLEQLYQPVEFDHAMHMDNFACSTCHHHTTGDGSDDPTCSRCHANSEPVDVVSCSGCHGRNDGGQQPDIANPYHIDKPGLKGALHLQCLGCHQSEGGPTGCRECHEFNAQGKKRFLITE